MPSKVYHVNINDLPRQSRFGGAFQETAVVMDAATLKFSWAHPLPAGSAAPAVSGRAAEGGKPDVHDFDQVILVMSGHLEATIGGETFEMHPGDLVYIPANVPHIGRLLGEEPAVGLDIFAPRRQDYEDMAAHQLEFEKV